MMRVTKKVLAIAPATLCLIAIAPSSATDLNIKVEVPRIEVAEYHRPYVAVWIENPDQSIATHLAVWYQTDTKKEDGTQWLKDLRQWWRRGGRELAVPVDGVTGATRPVGEHRIALKGNSAALSQLAPGKYALVTEAVREVGGRELVKIPFEWPAAQKQQLSASGKVELGTVSLDVIP
jgi:hypothetical protein